MFVNVDWFFLSHRLPIAKSSIQNDVDMSVYTDLTKGNEFHQFEEFSLFQSPISRSSRFFGFTLFEFIKTYLLIIKEKPDLVHAVTRITRTPFVGAISGFGPVSNQTNWLYKLRFKVVLLVYKFIFSSKFAMAICQSKHDVQTLLKYRVCSESKISIIPGSGVDLDKFNPNKFEKGEQNILMASRMLLDKGIMEFCSAA